MRAIVSSAPDVGALARRELEAVLPAGSALSALGPGVWLAEAPGSFAARAAELAATVFVRHCCPVASEVPVAGEAPDALAQALLPAALGCLRGAVEPVGVQARLLPGAAGPAPGPLAAALRQALNAAGRPTTGGRPASALSVVVGRETAYVGASPLAQNLSPWPGGEARLRRRPDEVSRSARKLEEALEVFGVQVPAGGQAVDLGAAPGGYTHLLLALGLRVVAVDTGALAPQLNGHPGLTHLQGAAHRVPLPAGPFDLLTADLSWDPLRAADCALRFRPRLVPGAPGLFTIKFFGGDPLHTVGTVRRRLEEGGYRVLAVRHLFHDREEATAHLRA